LSEFGILAASGVGSSAPLQVNFGTIGTYPSADTTLASGTTASFPYELGTLDAYSAQLMALSVFACATDPGHGFVNLPGSPSGGDWLINGTIAPGYYKIPNTATNGILGQLTFAGTNSLSDVWVIYLPNNLLINPYLVHALTGGALADNVFTFVEGTVTETTSFTSPVSSAILGSVFAKKAVALSYSYTGLTRMITTGSTATFGSATFVVAGCSVSTFCLPAPVAPPVAPPVSPPVPPPIAPPVAPPVAPPTAPPTIAPVAPPPVAPPTTPTTPAAAPISPVSIAALIIAAIALAVGLGAMAFSYCSRGSGAGSNSVAMQPLLRGKQY
jgi:hypothetical protein